MQTQERLLDAAAKIFARSGVAGAAIEEIANAAGYSRGAFHANFASKDALFLTLIERRVKSLIAEIHGAMVAPQTVPEAEQHLRIAIARYTGEDKEAFLLLTEAQLYALRNPRFGKKLNALFGSIYDELTASVAQLQGRHGRKDRDNAKQLVLIGFALSHGLSLHNLMNPERYPDSMVSDSLEFVFDRIFP